jgi:activating signal cointegrator complex subunit 2
LFYRDSILRRFEYESDDDYFEDEDESSYNSNQAKTIDPMQATLLSTYISSPSIFSRTSESRKLSERQNLIKSTKLSHEQIEGWALMLERNPKKSNIIQDFIMWRNTQ